MKKCWCPQKGMRVRLPLSFFLPQISPCPICCLVFQARQHQQALMSGAFPQKITRKVTNNPTVLCEFAFQGTRLTHKMPTEFFNQAKKILPLEAMPITKPREVRFF